MIDFLYVFNFSINKLAKAIERLNCSIKSIYKFNKDFRILILDASEKNNKHFLEEKENIIYIHKPFKGYFNKCVLINHLVKNYVQTEYFIFSDIDLIYPPGYIEKMKKKIKKDIVRIIPYNHNVFEDKYTSIYNYIKHYDKNEKGGFAHGNGLIHTESFIKIQGYDEEFIGYAPEDDMFNQRIGKINKLIYDRDIVTYHLFHEAADRKYHSKMMHIYFKKLEELNNKKQIELEDIIGNKNKEWGVY